MTSGNESIAASPKNNEPYYMMQLDALRAIAVFCVLAYHYLPSEVFVNSRLNWGPLGVRLFFVISGFLITGILLRCRDLIDVNKQDFWFTIKRFYIRRFIRILPLYYLTIIATIILAFQLIQPSLFWHLTFTSNIYFTLRDWDRLTSHFWSLAVEEQFYFIWPWLILSVPRKHLLKLMVITAGIAPIFRLLMIALNLDNGRGEYILTFSCLDSLGMGAILAFYTHHQHQLKLAKYLGNFSFWFGLPLFVCINFIPIPNIDYAVILVVKSSVNSIFFMGLIARAAQGFKGAIGKILELRLLVYFGKISYGIYIYHILVRHVVHQIFVLVGLVYPSSIWIKFALNTVVTLIVAVLSWHFFEKPINDLKRYFRYKKENRSAQ